MNQEDPAHHSLKAIAYDLPDHLIASKPVEPRDASRLLHLNKVSGETKHLHFSDLPSLLSKGDVLVRNTSKVVPARLFANKPTGGRVEVLLNRLLNPASNTWECLLHPGVKTQTVLSFPGGLTGIIYKDVQNSFTFQVRFNCDIEQLYLYLNSSGHVPLPPYIPHMEEYSENYWREVYQTTYAKENGSVAAPTAGLHFTPQLDALLVAKGVQIEEVNLHVGLGTFAQIKTDDYTKHSLHHEDFELSEETAERINVAKKEGRRIVAVGTTTVRVLEHCALEIPQPLNINNLVDITQRTGVDQSLDQTELSSHAFSSQLQPQKGTTNIFIYPPYQFKMVDALITNFHLPGTSLLLLVSAFASQPNTTHPFTTFLKTTVGKAYLEAINKKYRFFSFGDAMMIE